MTRQRKEMAFILPLAVGAAAYAMLYYVRTQQAWLEFGKTVDLYPVAGLLRSFELPVSVDQLRWLSYALFVIISLSYVWAIYLASN